MDFAEFCFEERRSSPIFDFIGVNEKLRLDFLASSIGLVASGTNDDSVDGFAMSFLLLLQLRLLPLS